MIQSFIEKHVAPYIGKLQLTNVSVLDNPFGIVSGGIKVTIERNAEVNHIINELCELYSFPIELKYFYNLCQLPTQELVLNNCTFLSLNRIKEMSEKYRSHGQDDFIDIIIKYAGMGHYVVYSWNKKHMKYVIRYDGGSNGYERDENYDKYIVNKYDFKDDEIVAWENLIKIVGK